MRWIKLCYKQKNENEGYKGGIDKSLIFNRHEHADMDFEKLIYMTNPPKYVNYRAWEIYQHKYGEGANYCSKYFIQIQFGEMSNESDKNHVVFGNRPRNHITGVIILNGETKKCEYQWVKKYAKNDIEEPMLYQEHVLQVLDCTEIEDNRSYHFQKSEGL